MTPVILARGPCSKIVPPLLTIEVPAAIVEKLRSLQRGAGLNRDEVCGRYRAEGPEIHIGVNDDRGDADVSTSEVEGSGQREDAGCSRQCAVGAEVCACYQGTIREHFR